MAMGELLDAYSRRARLQPAFLMLIPLLITVGTWTPGIFTWGAGLLGLGTSCGVIVWLAHFARERGRAAEELLFKSWGGSPTTVWLRHQSKKLDAVTKARYFAFFKKNIPKWRAPTQDEENKSLADADGYYASAVRWLLEYTRDRKQFRMVFEENVSYGFRRNLYGLRKWGIALAILCLVVNLAFLVGAFDSIGLFLPGRGLVSFGVCVATILGWSSVVRPQWVRDAAEAYAKTLFACCEVVTKKE